MDWGFLVVIGVVLVVGVVLWQSYQAGEGKGE